MNVPPPLLTESGNNPNLARWLNWLRAFSIAGQLRPGINAEIERTTMGTVIKPKPGGGSTPATDDLTWL